MQIGGKYFVLFLRFIVYQQKPIRGWNGNSRSMLVNFHFDHIWKPSLSALFLSGRGNVG